MESIYAALLIFKVKGNKAITEANLDKVLKAAGADVDPEQIKKLVIGLKSTDLDAIIKNASTMPVGVSTAPVEDKKKPSKKKKEPEKEEVEEEPAGIGSLF